MIPPEHPAGPQHFRRQLHGLAGTRDRFAGGAENRDRLQLLRPDQVLQGRLQTLLGHHQAVAALRADDDAEGGRDVPAAVDQGLGGGALEPQMLLDLPAANPQTAADQGDGNDEVSLCRRPNHDGGTRDLTPAGAPFQVRNQGVPRYFFISSFSKVFGASSSFARSSLAMPDKSLGSITTWGVRKMSSSVFWFFLMFRLNA